MTEFKIIQFPVPKTGREIIFYKAVRVRATSLVENAAAKPAAEACIFAGVAPDMVITAANRITNAGIERFGFLAPPPTEDPNITSGSVETEDGFLVWSYAERLRPENQTYNPVTLQVTPADENQVAPKDRGVRVYVFQKELELKKAA